MEDRTAPLNRHVNDALLSRNRLLAALLFALLCCLALVCRLVYLQSFEHQFYSTLSAKNLLDMLRLAPARGLIYDRNGILLAKNIPSYVVSLIPEKIDNLEKTLHELKKILPIDDDDIQSFQQHRYQYRAFDPVPLKSGLSEQDIYRFYVNQYQFSGVNIGIKAERYYPLGAFASEILGYTGPINTTELQDHQQADYRLSDSIGKAGIERYYETLLRGKAGVEQAEINASGHIVRQLTKTPPVAGKNLYLTIDSELQKKAHQLLGKENGSIVAIKPDTGEVLALVSHPSFDPNLFIDGISQKNYQRLLQSPHHPLFNRAINGQFAAGSTLKPFIALSSLDSGLITTQTRFYDPGWFQLPNTEHVYHDWKYRGHGWINVTKAIEVSCDTYFYNLAAKLTINELNHMLGQFGFGQKTGIDLSSEKTGIVPSPNWKMAMQGEPWYKGDTVETIIGQGFFLVTPLQLATATSILANRGQHLQPHLLLKTRDEQGHISFTNPKLLASPTVKRQSSWDTIIKAMQKVVDGQQGTAIYFGKNRGYTVAAKTGTAQIYGHSRDENRSQMNIPKRLRNNHLFIAFAPVKHPQIALAVVVEHSAYADKIAGKLIKFYLNKK